MLDEEDLGGCSIEVPKFKLLFFFFLSSHGHNRVTHDTPTTLLTEKTSLDWVRNPLEHSRKTKQLVITTSRAETIVSLNSALHRGQTLSFPELF